MKTVRSALEVLDVLDKDSKLIVFGGGKYGQELRCELNLCDFWDYYVCDSNNEVGKYVDNFIPLDEIYALSKRFSVHIVIAVKDDIVVKEIYNKIMTRCSDSYALKNFYQYISESREELIKRRKDKGFKNGNEYKRTLNNNDATKALMDMITGSKPFLFARWGAECDLVYRIRAGVRPTLKECMYLKSNLGVFPITTELITHYFKIMEMSAREMDILCAFYWQKPLDKLIEWYSADAVLVSSNLEYPFFSNPWTKALEGMKVLVIHPFAKLIEEQYRKRDKLFVNKEVLPKFELVTYKAIQSLGGNDNYKDWIEALEKMQNDISNLDFDIALIGCGAYGMPLGAYIKSKLHKKAIHMGGSLQILFGIKGKRWESESYDYQHRLYNEYWVRPTDDLKPKGYENVENGCYW